MLSTRVLIVGSRFSKVGTWATVLTTAGVSTRSVDDPSLVRDACAEFNPRVLILDLGLPFQSGLELCRSIRDFASAESLLVVFVSGYDGPGHKYKAIEGGANFVVKPTDQQRLLELVKSTAAVPHSPDTMPP